jgi:hypothetical protein
MTTKWQCCSAVGFCILAWITLPVAAHAASTYEWTNPVTGTYSTAGNCNLVSGNGTPPVAGDTAEFNDAGTYAVTYTD